MIGRTSLVALGLVAVATAAVVPALGAPGRSSLPTLRTSIGFFTPAVADPKLAAIYARNGTVQQGFRFTPVATGRNRAITVAVRANRGGGMAPADRTESARLAPSASPSIGISPVSYNLGASVGWKSFALQGDVSRLDTGPLPGGRESAKVSAGVSNRKWATRVQLEAARPTGQAPRTIAGTERLSVDVAGSYRLTRNLDVTAGVRYQSDRDRLERVNDPRRDSQAVYVGTAFRF